MRRSLDDAIDPPAWPEGVHVRAWTDADATAVHALLVEGYRHGGGVVAEFGAWREAFVGDPEFDASACLIAEEVARFHESLDPGAVVQSDPPAPMREPIAPIPRTASARVPVPQSADVGTPGAHAGSRDAGDVARRPGSLKSPDCAEPSRPLAGVALCWSSGFVKDLVVAERWRRRGLGEALLVAAMREFRARGFAGIGLKVDADNPSGAPRMYLRLGFEVTERIGSPDAFEP